MVNSNLLEIMVLLSFSCLFGQVKDFHPVHGSRRYSGDYQLQLFFSPPIFGNGIVTIATIFFFPYFGNAIATNPLHFFFFFFLFFEK